MGMWQNLVAGYEANEKSLEAEFYYLCTLKKGKGQNSVLDAIVVKLDDSAQVCEICNYCGEDDEIALLETEESAGRAGKITLPKKGEDFKLKAKAVFDSWEYVAITGVKHDYYMRTLRDFVEESNNADVRVVLDYCVRDTLRDDVNRFGVNPNKDTLVLFSVERKGVLETRLWKMPNVFSDWRKFCFGRKRQRALDMITGKEMPIALMHGKKINNNSANSKLISANDDKNFTYRGKLVLPEQVVTIGYETTEKAHQFLRYLIATRGIKCDTQVLVTWTINADDDLPQPPVTSDEFEFEDEGVGEDERIELAAKTGIDFAQSIRGTLMRGRLNNAFVKHPKTAVLMLDAATDGRMAVVFYRELDSEEYLERIAAWHELAAWRLTYSTTTQGEDGKIQSKYHVYVGAPTVDRIIQVVFGRQKSASDDGYKKMKRQMRELIVRVIFDGQPLPVSFIERALSRLSRPLSFIDSKDKYGKLNFMDELAVFCSMLKQDYLINRKEKIEMQLDVNCSDRNYLFGRLLGAADKLEEYALARGDKDRMVTAAIRYMQLFAQRPCTTWGTIHSQLQPYIQKIKGSIAFREIEEIQATFRDVADFQNDTPLNALYLLGYYQERLRIAELAKAFSEAQHANNQTNNEQE